MQNAQDFKGFLMQAAFSKLYYVLSSDFKDTPSLAVLHRIGGQMLERFWSTGSCLKMGARGQTNIHVAKRIWLLFTQMSEHH